MGFKRVQFPQQYAAASTLLVFAQISSWNPSRKRKESSREYCAFLPTCG
jgi:hypothetical protein